jgi:hypothetical protein
LHEGKQAPGDVARFNVFALRHEGFHTDFERLDARLGLC